MNSRETLGFLFLIGLAVVLIGSPILNLVTQDTVMITVKDKERVSSGNSKYLVWTEEGEVFEDTDVMIFLKYNSSDLYGELQVGRTYVVKVSGVRVRFLSWYRNIIEIIERVD